MTILLNGVNLITHFQENEAKLSRVPLLLTDLPASGANELGFILLLEKFEAILSLLG